MSEDHLVEELDGMVAETNGALDGLVMGPEGQVLAWSASLDQSTAGSLGLLVAHMARTMSRVKEVEVDLDDPDQFVLHLEGGLILGVKGREGMWACATLEPDGNVSGATRALYRLASR